MKKIFAIILMALLLFSYTACSNSNSDESSGDNVKQGLQTLAGKTPLELYNSAIDYVKSLVNFESTSIS